MEFISNIKNNIDTLYEENMQLKIRLLAFLNSLIMLLIENHPN